MNRKMIKAGKSAVFRRTLLSMAVAGCFGVALAQPIGPQVINGSVNFATQGNILNITNSPNAIINWQGFSISPNEVTRFIQQNGSSSVLNRVVGLESSAILGALQSNGKVYLINPNGILFGPNARVDVNGLIASTLDIKNQDFLAGKYQFDAGTVAGRLENQGAITTPGGGQIVLIAPDVQNSGIVTSPKGEILLAAGKSVQLVDTANPDMAVVVSAPENQVLNLGQVVGQGGKVGIYGALINQRGKVNADSAVVGENGKIVFKASKDALLEAGSVTSATGAGKGGEIQVLGERVGLTGDAKVDASGQQGGGTVLVGGDYQGKNPEVRNAQVTYVGPETQIKADAVQNGDGGKVIVWADDTTRAYGSISARGGVHSGNGGFVETSGKRYLDVLNAPDNSAVLGKGGTWLLDPEDITISSGSDANISSGPTFQPGTTGSSTLNATTLTNYLVNTGDVTIDTTCTSACGTNNGSITVSAPVAPVLTADRTLTLNAHKNITIDSGAGIDATGGSNKLHVTLLADQDNDLSGAISLNDVIKTKGGNVNVTSYDAVTLVANKPIDSGGGQINITVKNPAAGINMPASSSIVSGGGSITLKADKMTFTSSSINAGAGSVTLNPYNSAAAISLGAGATDSTANTLELSNDELKTITSSGTLTIGAAGNSGAMSLASALDLTSGAGLTGPLTLEAGTSGFTVGNAMAVPAGLNIHSGGAVAINANVSAKSVEFWADTITVTGGSVTATGTADGDVMRFRPKAWTDIALGTYANSLQIDPAQLGTPGGTGKSFYANNYEFDAGSTGTVYVNSAVNVPGSTLAIEGGTVNLSANVTGKNVRYMADSMVFGSAVTTAYCPATPCTNSGGISFAPYTIASRPIVIGGADPGNALWLPSTVVDGVSPQIVGQYLEFGSTSLSGTPTNGGGITIASPITGGSASFKGVGLSTSGAINQSTAGDIISLPSYDATTCPDCGGLKINAGTATLDVAPNVVDFVSAKTTGAFNFKNSKSLKTGDATKGIEAGGATAITVTAGDVMLGTISAPQVTITAKDKIVDDNGSSNNITSSSITLVSQNGATAGTIAISADISQSGSGGVLSATVDPSTSTYGGISLRNVSTSSWTPTTVTLTDNASDPTGGIINNVANSVHLSHAGDLILSGKTISTSGRNLQLNVAGTLGLLSSSQISGQTVSVVAGNLDMNGSSITANSAGGIIKVDTSGNIRLNNGSSIMAAQDVYLTLKGSNSYLYLNDSTGQANPSRVSTGVPQTTHVTFQARQSAGIVIDGVTTDTTVGPWAGASGIYDSTMSPAVAGTTLQLSYYSAPAPAPSAPPPPTVDQCVTNPALTGCSTVLPSLDACATNPALAGCAAVLPTLDQCAANPTAAGCSAVLPTLVACTANPSAAGCTVVLPTISQCASNPSAPGCSAVLPTLGACTANPSAAGCSVVLPTLNACVANPSAAGCTAVLPTINQCASNPSALGCSAVLPTLDACTVNPGAAGCSVVLPTLDACTANPAAAGCTAVLPTLDQCAANPSAAGCSVVLPTKLPDVIKEVEKTDESKTLNQTINQTNNTLNNASLTSVVKPQTTMAMLSAPKETQASGDVGGGGSAGEAPGRSAGSEKQDDKAADEKKDEKKDDKKKDATAQKEDKKDDAPKKKQYCN